MRWLALLLALLAPVLAAQSVSVGSKAFNEGVILGEVLTQTARGTGAEVQHKARMGGADQWRYRCLRRLHRHPAT